MTNALERTTIDNPDRVFDSPRSEWRFSTMPEIFRKHYSYGETIPILDTYVGMGADFFEVTEGQAATGPFIKAVLTASAGL
jgi:hypothetical protein